MSILKRAFQAVERSSINIGRTRARLYLLGRDDRFLADNGLSRERLERGNRAWPWRAETPTATRWSRTVPAVSDPASVASAFATRDALVPAMSPLPGREPSGAIAELAATGGAHPVDSGTARPRTVETGRDDRPVTDREAA